MEKQSAVYLLKIHQQWQSLLPYNRRHYPEGQLQVIQCLFASLLIGNNTGYIKINRFAETTFNEFKTGLTRLKQNGIESLIIDLRDNGGGYMEEAIAIADEFLKDKQLIVFTKNKNDLQ